MITVTTRLAAAPRRRVCELIVVAASAGGVPALKTLFKGLPPGFPVPVAAVLHRTRREPHNLAGVLGRGVRLRVKLAEQGEQPQPGTIYLAPPAHHLVVRPDRTLHLMDGLKIKYLLSSANPLFESAAYALDGDIIAVVLSGGGTDGINGVQAVAGMGGTVIAQDPASAEFDGMPRAAIASGAVNDVLSLGEIAPALVRLVAQPRSRRTGSRRARLRVATPSRRR
jgi:two-component system chemotaxis response regulator CheB